jgi:chitinase
VPASSSDTGLYSQFNALKSVNPSLKTFIAIGGASLGGRPWSVMTSSTANRATFINSALQFVKTWGFDGVDLDWEYPVSTDTNGSPADTVNFVSLVREMRAAFGSVGMTVTLPVGNYYLQYFDVNSMQPYVDWFNVMSYDIHGTWDNPPVVAPHTSLIDIDSNLSLLWKANISPSKVVLGLAYYGHTYTLASSSCNTVGCAFTGAGTAGSCTQAAGMLAYSEIQSIITQYGITPVFDTKAAVKSFSYASNQWVNYDDADTLKLKLNYANSLCLAGTSKCRLMQKNLTNSGVGS